MSDTLKECIGCEKRYSSLQDADLCPKCYLDYEGIGQRSAKGEKGKGEKGRGSGGGKTIAPGSRVMEDSRTQRQRTRGDAGRAAIEEEKCGTCGGTGRSGGQICPTCNGDGFPVDPQGAPSTALALPDKEFEPEPTDPTNCLRCHKPLTFEELERYEPFWGDDPEGLVHGYCDACAGPIREQIGEYDDEMEGFAIKDIKKFQEAIRPLPTVEGAGE